MKVNDKIIKLFIWIANKLMSMGFDCLEQTRKMCKHSVLIVPPLHVNFEKKDVLQCTLCGRLIKNA